MKESKENRLKVRQLTEYERKMLQKKREEHKLNITGPQIVQGIEYRGEGFKCSDELIEFKDFEIGKVYSKTLKLTNVSLSFNSFRFLPIEEQYSKYFEIEHKPAGRVSAGITVHFKLNFYPQVRQDINFTIPVLCETGKIELPVSCMYKRTKIELEQTEVDFGETIIGEEKVVTFKIQNKGGLKTKFEFRNSSGKTISNTVSTMFNLSTNSLKSGGNDSNNHTINNDELSCDINITNEFFIEEMNIDFNPIIEAYSEQIVSLTYKPINIKKWKTKLQIYFFNFIDQQPIVIDLKGESSSVPIRVLEETIDFGICIYDSVYKDKVVFENNSKNTSKVEILAPMESKDFIHFNPSFAFIQPKSNLEIWIKVETNEKIMRYCEKFLKGEDTLHIPFKLVCSEQKMQIEFYVKFRLTTQTLSYQKSLNFENVFEGTTQVKYIDLHNHSLLIQKVLFYKKPNCIEIEPQEIPYILLPGEEKRLKIIYKAVKINKSSGTIRGKVIVGKETTKEIEISYKANVIKLPLKFSALSVEFPSLQPGEISKHIIQIKNISFKTYIFEIQPPDNSISGLKFVPLVNKINKEKAVKVMIEFKADYRDFTFDQYESLCNSQDTKEGDLQQELEEFKTQLEEINSKLESKISKTEKTQFEEQKMYTECKIEEINKELIERKEEKRKLFKKEDVIRSFGGEFKNLIYKSDKTFQYYRWLVPIVFKPIDEPDTATSVVYLELKTYVKAPILFCDRAEINFGRIPVGFKKVDHILIRNNGDREMELLMDVLPLSSSFNFLSVLKKIAPGEEKNFSISFEPIKVHTFCENLKIYAENSINIQLKGESILPDVDIIHNEQKYLDMGACLKGDTIEKSFEIVNKCEFDLGFEIEVDKFGMENRNGKKPFVFTPFNSVLKPYERKTVTVKFQPEFASEYYFCVVKLKIEQQKRAKEFFIKGTAHSSQFFIQKDFDFSESNINSFISSFVSRKGLVSIEPAENVIPLVFPKEENESDSVLSLNIGCIKLNQSNLEKPLDYEFKPDPESNNQHYFTLDNMKGKINSGSQVKLNFKAKMTNMDQYDTPDILNNIGRWVTLDFYLSFTGGYTVEEETNREFLIRCKKFINTL